MTDRERRAQVRARLVAAAAKRAGKRQGSNAATGLVVVGLAVVILGLAAWPQEEATLVQRAEGTGCPQVVNERLIGYESGWKWVEVPAGWRRVGGCLYPIWPGNVIRTRR